MNHGQLVTWCPRETLLLFSKYLQWIEELKNDSLASYFEATFLHFIGENRIYATS